MRRYTETDAEFEHFCRIASQIPYTAIVKVNLLDGQILEGVLKKTATGNNAGHGGEWRWHGELAIETRVLTRLTINYLDIESVTSAMTPAILNEYRHLRLIETAE